MNTYQATQKVFVDVAGDYMFFYETYDLRLFPEALISLALNTLNRHLFRIS